MLILCVSNCYLESNFTDFSLFANFFYICSSTDESCEEDEKLLPNDQSDFRSALLKDQTLNFLSYFSDSFAKTNRSFESALKFRLFRTPCVQCVPFPLAEPVKQRSLHLPFHSQTQCAFSDRKGRYGGGWKKCLSAGKI